MTPEQHNVLSELCKLGLQRLADAASAALAEVAPVPAEPGEPAHDPENA